MVVVGVIFYFLFFIYYCLCSSMQNQFHMMVGNIILSIFLHKMEMDWLENDYFYKVLTLDGIYLKMDAQMYYYTM